MVADSESKKDLDFPENAMHCLESLKVRTNDLQPFLLLASLSGKKGYYNMALLQIDLRLFLVGSDVEGSCREESSRDTGRNTGHVTSSRTAWKASCYW